MLLKILILTSFETLRDARSVSAVYHLLTGKSSIQTVQDAHIYDLKEFYGIYPDLQRTVYDEQINVLSKQGFLIFNSANTIIPSNNNKNWLAQNYDSTVQYFKGHEYLYLAPMFWDRLLLLIQTITNTKMNHFHFIPLIDKQAVTAWVKQQYRRWRSDQSYFLQQLYQELHQILRNFSDKKANIFVDSLTGYDHYGMTRFQIANRYDLPQYDIPLIRTAILHEIITIIKQNQESYTLLGQLLDELPREMPITHSAKKTKKLLDKQYPIETIASMRELKLNTIYDHMVEIALYDDAFPLRKYVSEKQQQEIREVINNASSYKLKDIKNQVSETIDYFHIRLVLATENIS